MAISPQRPYFKAFEENLPAPADAAAAGIPLSDEAKAAVVAGARIVPITTLAGARGECAVHLLPFRRMTEYQRVMDNEATTVALFTGLAPEVLDTFSHESLEAILQAGEEINLAPFSRFLNRQMERHRKLMPDLEERLVKAALAPSTPPIS